MAQTINEWLENARHPVRGTDIEAAFTGMILRDKIDPADAYSLFLLRECLLRALPKLRWILRTLKNGTDEWREAMDAIRPLVLLYDVADADTDERNAQEATR